MEFAFVSNEVISLHNLIKVFSLLNLSIKALDLLSDALLSQKLSQALNHIFDIKNSKTRMQQSNTAKEDPTLSFLLFLV